VPAVAKEANKVMKRTKPMLTIFTNSQCSKRR